MQEEDLQTEEGKALQEGENTPQHAEETQREQSETAQTSQNAEIVEPEAIEGDFVSGKIRNRLSFERLRRPDPFALRTHKKRENRNRGYIYIRGYKPVRRDYTQHAKRRA